LLDLHRIGFNDGKLSGSSTDVVMPSEFVPTLVSSSVSSTSWSKFERPAIGLALFHEMPHPLNDVASAFGFALGLVDRVDDHRGLWGRHH
jgi:hypothetical protein